MGGRGELGRRGRGEVGRIGRVNNSKVELRWVGGGGGCNNDFRDRSSTVSINMFHFLYSVFVFPDNAFYFYLFQ